MNQGLWTKTRILNPTKRGSRSLLSVLAQLYGTWLCLVELTDAGGTSTKTTIAQTKHYYNSQGRPDPWNFVLCHTPLSPHGRGDLPMQDFRSWAGQRIWL
jgi:hypothetical protein